MTAPRRWRFVHLAVLRPLLTVTALVCLYYLLPVDQAVRPWTMAVFTGGLAVVALLVVGEVRMILRSPFPAWQGAQALALIVPLFLLLFADLYYVLGHDRPGSFDVGLTRTDALYFTVTVFATVGFGDIAPVSATARALVTVQMVADLVVLSVVLRVIVTAVQRRRSSTRDSSVRRRQQHGGDQPGHGLDPHGGEGRRGTHRGAQVGHTARDPRDAALGRIRPARLHQVHRRGQHDPHPGAGPHQEQHEGQAGEGDDEAPAAEPAPGVPPRRPSRDR
ncbi:potassium channel family protein [Amycolatopsis sp. NPDC049159]|uniref:potassium channel family protein n=1 Tax=Amycolatopsis sp. NPDC049159 TaxID=3157210 RepID=UPI0033CF72D4